ncbi:SDR family NAD(P)-dependent oxidoreductase [Porphyrobacter sp. AAP60]|uniref:SDR family NAD(P)-dependent oxidoreductase n=1 Tax=Porphyrobacter sp. AAP60 TaxID=1523423 RepID=UPI0006B9F501|nr:SDR family oxidoreductase [Porphyrobacter sp. AAP60]KPF63667.1 short-chain dehydrogenase [Porphyrobacter sp. AAP60]
MNLGASGRVAGKIALVTGGAMGLGKADCEALAREGAKVIVTDRDAELAHQVADSIGGDALALDVTDEDQWAEVMRAVQERHGGLDILVNNAGNVIFESIEECSTAHFRLHLDIHVVGTFFGCKYALPLMKHRHETIGGGGSSIINMASTAALMGYGNIPAYTASKAAIAGMTRSLAVDFQDKGYGVRVNALAPGGIETPMVMGISGRGGEKPMDIPEGPLAADALGHPRDVAGCVLFLASDEARFLNGLTIPVDNGLYARPHH